MKVGTNLIIPTSASNNVNNSTTFKPYNESGIIGSTLPEIHVQQKKKSRWQKFVSILIVIIVVVVAVYAAAFIGPAVFGAASAAVGGGALGVVAGTVAAAGAGFAVGVATSYGTQGIAILAGLQEEFSWSAARDMGTNFAFATAGGAISSWAGATFESSAVTKSLINAGVELSSQYAQNDGKITNVAGVILAMAPAANDYLKNGSPDWLKTLAGSPDAVKSRVISSGLGLVEQASHEGTLNSMNWVSAAASSFAQAPSAHSNATSINWGAVAQDALVGSSLAVLIGQHRGSESGYAFLEGQASRIAGDAAKVDARQRAIPINQQIQQQYNPKYANAETITNSEGAGRAQASNVDSDNRRMATREQVENRNVQNQAAKQQQVDAVEALNQQNIREVEQLEQSRLLERNAIGFNPTGDDLDLRFQSNRQDETYGGLVATDRNGNPVDTTGVYADLSGNISEVRAYDSSDEYADQVFDYLKGVNTPTILQGESVEFGQQLNSNELQFSTVASSAINSDTIGRGSLYPVEGDGLSGLFNSFLGEFGLGLSDFGIGNSIQDSADIDTYRNTSFFGSEITHGDIFDVTSTAAEVLGFVEGGLVLIPKLLKSGRHLLDDVSDRLFPNSQVRNLRPDSGGSFFDIPGPAPRGEAIEIAVGKNTPGPFKGIDRFEFETGEAISIKSKDLSLPSFNKEKGLRNSIRADVRKLDQFEGSSLKGFDVFQDDISSKTLELVIQQNKATSSQRGQILDAMECASKKYRT